MIKRSSEWLRLPPLASALSSVLCFSCGLAENSCGENINSSEPQDTFLRLPALLLSAVE